jgi:hypothetical protein
MKNKIFSVLTILTACSLFAAVPEAKKVTRSYHRHHKIYGKGEYYQLSRERSNYLIYFQWVNTTQTQEDQVLIGLPEPNFWSGFNRRGMFNLIINDISVFSLEPKKITVFNTKNEAGINALYNFDGVWMNIRFFLDDRTPLLHVECSKDAKSCKEVKSMALHIGVSPTVTGMKNGSYKREVMTSARTYKNRGWTNLKPDDTEFFIYDTVYEGSAKLAKSNGPAYLKMSDAVRQSARMHYGNSSTVSFQFKIKPETQKFSFSLLELTRKSTNKEFLDYLISNNLLKKSEK